MRCQGPLPCSGEDGITLSGKVEECRKITAIGKLGVGVPELIEEGVCAGIQGGEAGGGGIFQ